MPAYYLDFETDTEDRKKPDPTLFDLPHYDLQSVLVLANRGSFKGASLSNFSQKEGSLVSRTFSRRMARSFSHLVVIRPTTLLSTERILSNLALNRASSSVTRETILSFSHVGIEAACSCAACFSRFRKRERDSTSALGSNDSNLPSSPR